MLFWIYLENSSSSSRYTPFSINSVCYFLGGHTWVNPSKRLVDIALDRWKSFKLRADNTSIVTVMLDPPGPPRAQVLRRLYGVQSPKLQNQAQPTTQSNPSKQTTSVQSCLSQQPACPESNENNSREIKPAAKRTKNEISPANGAENTNAVSSATNGNATKGQLGRVNETEEPAPIAIISR